MRETPRPQPPPPPPPPSPLPLSIAQKRDIAFTRLAEAACKLIEAVLLHKE